MSAIAQTPAGDCAAADPGRSAAALAIVLGRGGSAGLPRKNVRRLAGRPLVCHAIDHAAAARCVSRIVVSTDCDRIAAAAAAAGVPRLTVLRRPAALASATATVAAAARQACMEAGGDEPIVVILYANVPLRPPGLIDRAVAALRETRADSVQSYCAVGKGHPFWMVRLDGEGRVEPFVRNRIDRRQDLPPLFVPDGGVIAVRRALLVREGDSGPHEFLGRDRRGIETGPGEVIDVDTALDLAVARAILRAEAGSGRPPAVPAEGIR
jgi:CMP-N-acetylneuraminic acid synthetase